MTPDEAAHKWAQSVIGKTHRPDPVEGHVSWVTTTADWRGGDRWRARCECGWFATPRDTFAAAEADRQWHRDGVAEGALF